MLKNTNVKQLYKLNEYLNEVGFSSDFKPWNRKCDMSIRLTGYLNVWEGSVRSAKTFISSIAFMLYVASCPENESVFIIAGNTIASLIRNVIEGEYGILKIWGESVNYRETKGSRLITFKTHNGIKKIYCFGAPDEKAWETLRGLTATGVYLDEVTTMPISFINETFSRTLKSPYRKHFWTLNPEIPTHEVYVEYLDRYQQMSMKERKELGGYYWWHFTLKDNPSLTPDIIRKTEKQYSGIYYRRFILGERVAGDGVIYDMVDDKNKYNNSTRPKELDINTITDRWIGCDIGSTNPTAFLDIRDDGDTLWVDREYYWNNNSDKIKKMGINKKTDTAYVDDLIDFIGNWDCPIIVDSQAANFKTEMLNRGLLSIDANKEKDSVINGIRACASMFAQGKIKINTDNCPNLLRELDAYSWDSKKAMYGTEAPIKTNDHCVDALRYVVYTAIPGYRRGKFI